MGDVTKRMVELLGEDGAQAVADAEEMLASNDTDLLTKAARLLVVGLGNDLPDDHSSALDYLHTVVTQLRSKPALFRRVLQTTRQSKALATARGMMATVRSGV